MIHFVFASRYYYYNPKLLYSMIREEMKKYKLKSIMTTFIYMRKDVIIPKGKMLEYCQGKKLDCKESINDDLESFFQDLKNGHKLRNCFQSRV